MVFGALAKNDSLGCAKDWLVCRVKPIAICRSDLQLAFYLSSWCTSHHKATLANTSFGIDINKGWAAICDAPLYSFYL